MTIEFHFKEGNASSGRFSMAVTPEGGVRRTIFDVTNYTHHPSDPAPDGMKHYNPMKLYTSNTVIDHVRNNGGVLQVYWDDLEIWKDTNILSNTPENEASESYELHPNPMNDFAILKFADRANERPVLRLYNALGELVRTINEIRSGQVVIRRGDLPGGSYFFQLSTERTMRLTGMLMMN